MKSKKKRYCVTTCYIRSEWHALKFELYLISGIVEAVSSEEAKGIFIDGQMNNHLDERLSAIVALEI